LDNQTGLRDDHCGDAGSPKVEALDGGDSSPTDDVDDRPSLFHGTLSRLEAHPHRYPNNFRLLPVVGIYADCSGGTTKSRVAFHRVTYGVVARELVGRNSPAKLLEGPDERDR
jgi:hypothetical protein